MTAPDTTRPSADRPARRRAAHRSALAVRVAGVALAAAALPTTALAYVGPGAGLGAIGTLFGIVAAVVLAMFGLFWYPIKRMLGRRSATADGVATPDAADPANGADDVAAPSGADRIEDGSGERPPR